MIRFYLNNFVLNYSTLTGPSENYSVMCCFNYRHPTDASVPTPGSLLICFETSEAYYHIYHICYVSTVLYLKFFFIRLHSIMFPLKSTKHVRWGGRCVQEPRETNSIARPNPSLGLFGTKLFPKDKT